MISTTSPTARRPGWLRGAPGRSPWSCPSWASGSSPRCSPGSRAPSAARDRDLLLYSLGDNVGRERFFRTMPVRQRVDGVVVLSVPVTDQESESLGSLNMPAVLIGAYAPGHSTVRIDDVEGGRVAVRHLTGLGHRRIGFIAGLRAAADGLHRVGRPAGRLPRGARGAAASRTTRSSR